VNENFIPFRFSADRIASLQQILNDSSSKSLNRDFHPVAYLARSKIWLSQFQDSDSSFLTVLTKTSFEKLLVIVSLTIGLLVLLIRIIRFSNRFVYIKTTALLAILSTGLIGISLELILLIGFQVIYGYVYYQMVVLIGFFMFGLGIGAGFALKIRDRFDLKRLLVFTTTLSVILPLFLVLALQALAAYYSSSHFLVWTFFPFCALLGGSLGGFQFPLISQLFYQTSKQQNIGIIYAVDVIGACIGSIMLSGWLMPWFGIRNAAILVGMVGLLPLFLILTMRNGISHEH
jgi:spermidine synthase